MAQLSQEMKEYILHQAVKFRCSDHSHTDVPNGDDSKHCCSHVAGVLMQRSERREHVRRFGPRLRWEPSIRSRKWGVKPSRTNLSCIANLGGLPLLELDLLAYFHSLLNCCVAISGEFRYDFDILYQIQHIQVIRINQDLFPFPGCSIIPHPALTMLVKLVHLSTQHAKPSVGLLKSS